MDSITGLFSILGYTAIFMTIMVGLINTCFSVMYLLPDAIFQFIGAHSSATSQAGRGEAQHVRDSALGGAGVGRNMQPKLDHGEQRAKDYQESKRAPNSVGPSEKRE